VVNNATEQIQSAESKDDQQAIVESHGTDQYLTFVMDEEEYGVDILSVQEIRGWEKTTKIPNSPNYLKGVINLRGTIVPIVDLRVKFNLESVEYTPITVVIVLKLAFEEGDRTVGIVVDAVSDVYSIVDDEIRESPDVTNSSNSSFIKGLANVNEKMVIILELDKLLDEHELPKNTEG
jgi:purine-binding chemotaxis protein CheW